MSEICPKCGLPLEICACQAIQKQTGANIKVYATKKRFNKLVTIVEGLSGDDLKRTAKELKTLLACGGSFKDGMIVLQGDHKVKVKEALVKMGYPDDTIKLITLVK